MKNKISMLLLSLPLSAFAIDDPGLPPKPGSGIKIIPIAQQSIPETTKQNVLKRIQEERMNGYVYSDNSTNSVRYLIDVQKNEQMGLAFNLMASQGLTDEQKKRSDNEIKHSLSELKFAFPMSKIPAFKRKDITVFTYIGAGGYDKNNLDNPGVEGWSGVRILFASPELGSCSYYMFYVRADRMAVQMNKETTEYLVNKKPTTRYIEGNKNSGFSYVLDWISKDSFNTIECANLKFDKKIMKSMIDLANQSDPK